MGIKLKPEDWRKVKMKDIIEYNKRYGLKSGDGKKEGKYPFLNSSQKITLYYDEAFYKDKEYLVVGTGGQELILHYMNQPFSASNDNFVLTIKNNILTKYVYYALLSQKDFIDTLYIGGGGIKHINQTRFNSIEILLPPLETQQQIVSYLDQQWEKIQSMEENLEKYANEVKKLEESILDGVFGEMKGKYKEVKIEEVYDVRDGTHDTPKYQEKGYPLITSKNLKLNKIDFSNVKYISKDDYDAINKRSKVDKGDLLFSMIGTIGNPTIVNINPNFAIKNVALFKRKTNNLIVYLKYFLMAPITNRKMLQEAKGIVQKFVGLTYLRNYKLPLPPLETQQQIVYYLDKQFFHINKLKENIKNQKDNIKNLKKALLNEIFDVVDEKELKG